MKYNITMCCGHDQIVELFGKTSERERRIKYLRECVMCDDCYGKIKDSENGCGCNEQKMLYSEYKNLYPECKTKYNSYNPQDKTIIVFIPDKLIKK